MSRALPFREAVVLVARREFMQRARDRSFFVSTAITIGIIVVVVVFPRALNFGADEYQEYAALARAQAVDVTAVLVVASVITALLGAAVNGAPLAPQLGWLVLVLLMIFRPQGIIPRRRRQAPVGWPRRRGLPAGGWPRRRGPTDA